MKILIVNNNMTVGGIQKSLVNLLAEVSEKHEITLMLFNPAGDLMDDIPDNVRIISGNAFTKIMGLTQKEAKNIGFFTALWRVIWVTASRILGSGFAYRNLSKLQKIRGGFDVAVSYMQNSEYRTFYGGCNEFVLNSVKAVRKISFVHCDMKNYIGNNPYNLSLYKQFDAVACVSDSCKRVFDEVVEGVNTYSVHNMYDFSSLESLACSYPVSMEQDKINIFTSARISPEKGIMRMMPIFSRIKADGGSFRWYIAGDGPQYSEAVKMAEASGLSDDVVFLGMIKNPYPYFKHSDMLLVPSYNEAAPMVYGEALFYKTPVFTTDTTSAYEMIGTDFGWVVENNDDAIYAELKKIVCSGEPVKKINASMSNEIAIGEFEKILK